MNPILTKFEESLERGSQFWRDPPRWAYLIVLPWALGLILQTYLAFHFNQVAGRQRMTQGQIVAHEPANHNSYRYVFAVDGRQYRGWHSPPAVPPSVGQRVQVFYDPVDPDTNALTDFTHLSDNELGPAGALVIGVTAAIGIIFTIRRRAAASRNASMS